MIWLCRRRGRVSGTDICARARTEKVDYCQCLTHVVIGYVDDIGGGRVPLTGMQAVVRRRV